MEPRDEWKAEEPDAGFADRVMARLDREERAPSAPSGPPRARIKALRWGVAGGLALAASIALAIGSRASWSAAHGDAIAKDREQMELGSRAIAVLEPGSHVAWDGPRVTQSAGDVFYRVEPGGPFVVHTPAGDVEVLGTCFRVKVEESAMNGRDVKVGAIGAAIGVAALVSVYEGKVAVSHAKESVTLTAGESARADGSGVRRTSEGAIAANANGANGGAGAGDEDPLVAANANLADTVRDYKKRLESIEADKKSVEKRLADAQEKLAIAENDGTAPAKKSQFDLTQDDWKKLAEEGKLAAHMPCYSPKGEEISAADLQKSGLAPQDKPVLQSAYDASRKRVWGDVIRPACIRALKGDAALADRLGPPTCESLVQEIARQNGEDTEEDMRQASEIRAGMRPMPADGGSDVLKMLLALTYESTNVEKDIAKSLGPDEAHRIVFDDQIGCWRNSMWGVDPRPQPPGK